MAGKYQAFDPNTEVNGYSMLGFIQCLRKEEIRPYLEMRGLDNIDPEGWYPLQSWLDVLSDLAEKRPGQSMFDFVAVGMKVLEMTHFPPGFETLSLPKMLAAGNEAYAKVQHRGGDAGEVVLEVIDPHHCVQKVRAPYPDDFWYGIFYGFCRRYLPPGTHFTVYYDENMPRREQGGEQTLIHITWE